MVTVNTLSLTLGKVMLQPGVLALLPLLTSSSLSQSTPHPPLHPLLCSFFWDYWPLLSPCKPFLIFLSVINLYLTDSILLYLAHIFFHLPPCLLPSSIALSPDAQESVNWLQEHELDIWKKEHNTLLFQAHWALFSYFKNHFYFNSLFPETSCSHTAELYKSSGHRVVKSCVIFFEA